MITEEEYLDDMEEPYMLFESEEARRERYYFSCGGYERCQTVKLYIKDLRCPIHQNKAFYKLVGTEDRGGWHIKVSRCCCSHFAEILEKEASRYSIVMTLNPPYTKQ